MGNIDKKVLSSVYQASKIGLDSVEYLYRKIESKELKNEINEYAKKYFNILEQAKDKLNDIGDTSYVPVNNEFMWSGVQNISKESKREDIAKVLMEGSKRGILQIVHYANNDMIGDDVKRLANILILYEKQNIENIEKYI